MDAEPGFYPEKYRLGHLENRPGYPRNKKEDLFGCLFHQSNLGERRVSSHVNELGQTRFRWPNKKISANEML